MERRICHCLLAGPGFTQTLGTDRVLLCKRRRPQCAGVPPPVPAPCVLLDGKFGQAEPRGSAILRIFLALNLLLCELVLEPSLLPRHGWCFYLMPALPQLVLKQGESTALH